MNMRKDSNPVYKNIALDIANKIINGEFKVGEKISGRSTLAGVYNVSPETIRRAIALLEGMDVVASLKGSGVKIVSISSAEKFISRNNNNENINAAKENVLDIIKQKKKLDEQLEMNLNKISDFIERFNNISPFLLIEVSIKVNCKVIGKKVNEIQLWQYTGATIIAYRRELNTIVSPGPDYVFTAGDTIVVIGNGEVYDKVCELIYD
ncbi:TrkA C-terminal domain-containing protein [Clostridium algidicarnis]|nr:TrkA C-terminal domain-containing protein [Clostridium algidicarnis]